MNSKHRSWPAFALEGLACSLLGFGLNTCIWSSHVLAGETDKYHGQVVTPGHPAKSTGGTCISTGPRTEANNCELALTGSELSSASGKKLRVIWLKSNTGSRDAKGQIIWRVEDALEHATDYRGTYDSEGCTSSAHPDADIIATGQWNTRKPPEVGGYLWPIEAAWRIDFATRKFIEIPTKGIVCELNEDRD